LRAQKTQTFVVLRDGTGFVQCLLAGPCAQTVDALDLTVESTVELIGTVHKVKEGQEAPNGIEVKVDWWRIVGRAPSGDKAFEGMLSKVRLSHNSTDK
jgi:asparaginyl-tRNA synthetase